MGVTMFPCNECAKLILQAGIVEVIYAEDKRKGCCKPCMGDDMGSVSHTKPDTTAFTWAASDRLFKLAGVNLRQHDSDITVTLTMRQRVLPLSRPIGQTLS